jgi:hypothetical protein
LENNLTFIIARSSASKESSLLLIWKNFKIVVFPILLYVQT